MLLKKIDNRSLKSAIGASARCQRNYDLSKSISAEDMDTIQRAIEQAPSKQNKKFFDAIIVQDQEKIHELYGATSFSYEHHEDSKRSVDYLIKKNTNPQILGSAVVVLVRNRDSYDEYILKNSEYKELKKIKSRKHDREELKLQIKKVKEIERIDEDRAVGVLAGYLSLTVELLGLKSGCCQCKNDKKIMDILNLQSEDDYMNKPLLMMGIGYKDTNRNRLEHQLHSEVVFPSFNKKVQVTYM